MEDRLVRIALAIPIPFYWQVTIFFAVLGVVAGLLGTWFFAIIPFCAWARFTYKAHKMTAPNGDKFWRI